MIRLALVGVLAAGILSTSLVPAWGACGFETGFRCPARGWQSLGGSIVGGPDAPSWTGTRVITRGVDNGYWIKSFNSSTQTWDSGFGSIGGNFTSDPGSAFKQTFSSERLDVFGRGSDGAVWTRRRIDGGWSPHWETLGGAIVGSPDATESDEFVAEVYALGVDGAVWTKAFDGNSWTGWSSIGGQGTSSPAVLQRFPSSGPNPIHVYVRGVDGALWERVRTGSVWSANWVSRGGNLTSGPDAATDYGFGQVFAKGQDNAYWTISTADGTNYSGWTTIGGNLTSDPGALTDVIDPGAGPGSTRKTVVFGRGSDGALWSNTLQE